MKQLIIKAFRHYGFDLKRLTPTGNNALRTKLLLEHNDIKLVLDVGANVGHYARDLREYGYLGTIISFEPRTKAYSILKKRSEGDPQWTVAERMAIGDYDGDIEINISENLYSSSVLDILDTHTNAAPGSAYVDKEISKIRKLDTIAKDYLINHDSIYLKIDVQGFEKQVLDGAQKLLPRIKGIQLELSLVPLYEGQVLYKQMIENIEDLGFEMNAIYPGFCNKVTGRMLQMDGVFFRK